MVLPSLLSSPAFVGKSWWGAAPLVLETVFPRQLDFCIRNLFLHSVTIDDEQVTEVTSGLVQNPEFWVQMGGGALVSCDCAISDRRDAADKSKAG